LFRATGIVVVHKSDIDNAEQRNGALRVAKTGIGSETDASGYKSFHANILKQIVVISELSPV
jgi:hypothetical protein